MRVAGDGLGGETIESSTERAAPRPLLQLAVGVEVGVTVLAPRQQVPVGSVRRRLPILILRGERSDC